MNTGSHGPSPLRYAVAVQVSAVHVALITAGAFVAIPIPGSPVPVVLQNLFVIMTGVVLPPIAALGTVLVYLLLGALGLPVFAGGAGGLAHFAGPTGGFLLGFLPAAGVTSLVLSSARRRGASRATVPTGTLAAAVAAGFLTVYLLGVPVLAVVLQMPLRQAAMVGMIPFLPGDILKAIALVVIIRTIPPAVWRSWT